MWLLIPDVASKSLMIKFILCLEPIVSLAFFSTLDEPAYLLQSISQLNSLLVQVTRSWQDYAAVPFSLAPTSLRLSIGATFCASPSSYQPLRINLNIFFMDVYLTALEHGCDGVDLGGVGRLLETQR